jgi:ribonuclease BN (tRNA processing enzyme)
LAGFLTNTATRSPIESAFAVTELHDGHHARVGSLRLTSRAVVHGVPAFAVRIEAAARSLVYSGDTAPCQALTELAEGCDVLLCEAESDQVSAEGERVHHTPEDAGGTAAAARAGQLVVTHVGRSLTPEHAVARASTRFDGPVGYAAPGGATRSAKPRPRRCADRNNCPHR